MGIIKILSYPQVALLTFTLFLMIYIVFLDKEGGFKNKFLKFGPDKNPSSSANFLGIKLDNWPKVIMLYIIGFVSSLMSSYYNAVMSTSVHTYVYNAAVDDIPYSKQLIYSVAMIEPFLYQILWIIQFYMDLIMELQFIIPQFIGSYIASVPFVIQMLGTKKYTP
jgi:hypothetical protein